MEVGGGRLRTPWAALALAALSLGGLAAGSGYAMAPTTVSGRAVNVHGRPVAGAEVVVERGAALPVTAFTTGASGRFAYAAGSHFAPVSATVSAPDYFPAVARPGVVTLHHRPLVQGRAVDEQGNGIAFARLVVEMPDGASVETMTDGDGFFGLDRGLAAGLALVTALAPGRDAYLERVPLSADQVAQVDAVLPLAVAWVDVATDPAGVAIL